MKAVMDKEKQKQMILNDNMWKVMFKLSWPAVIAMVLYGLNSVFDAIFVGRYVGETALAGVSVAYPLSQMTLGIGSLIGVGAGSALSIALGANDNNTQKRIMGNLNYLTLIISIVYAIVVYFFADTLVGFMGGQGETLLIGSSYFKVTVLGSVFWVHGLAANMVVRAEGKMKSAALMMGIGLLVNLVANYILVGVMGFGAVGAAWGTNIGMLVYTILGLTYFSRSKASFEAHPFKIYRDKKIIKSIMSMGMSSLIMSVMSLVQATVALNAISNFGTTAEIAFYGAAFRIFTLMLTPLFGLMRALQPVAGINYGANKNERVIKSVKVFITCGMIIMLPAWIAMMASPQSVLSLILPNTVFSTASLFNFRVFMFLLPILPAVFMAMTFFPAIDKGKLASITGILRQVILYIPVMLTLPRLLGIEWVYYSSTAIDVIVAIGAFSMFGVTFKKLRQRQNEFPLEKSKESEAA
jgi:putative MATE family efflux protein